MIRDLEIAPLGATRVDQAYPLYREILPDHSLAEWRDLAARFHASGALAPRGFIAVERGGYFRGLCSFEVCPSLGGSVLLIDHIVVLDPFAPRQLGTALHDYVMALAHRHGCHKCVVSLSSASSWLQATWQNADGAGPVIMLYCLPIDPAVRFR